MNGLGHITIDGKRLDLKFGLPALRRIVEKMTQFDLLSGDQYNELGISHILYSGYVNACAMRDLSPAIAYEVFYNHIENLTEEDKDEVVAAIRAFEDSKFIKDAFKKKAETQATISPQTGTT